MPKNPDGERLLALAQAARPVNDDDYGSERQIEAQTAFAEAIDSMLTPEQRTQLWDHDCDKATTDEMIEHALRAVGIRHRKS